MVYIGTRSGKGLGEGNKKMSMIMMFVGNPAMERYLPALSAGFLAFSVTAPASAQYTCTTNYCISSQSIAFQTPPGWPAVPVETCCQTHWGALPDGIDWNNGTPVMI